MKNLEQLVSFYEHLTLADMARLSEFYTPDAWFKDPFNEVVGVAAITAVFEHMFEQVKAPRFKVLERIVDNNGTAVLVWEFWFRSRLFGDAEQVMRGVSHLRFAADGRVSYHRDYWDAAEELYTKVPVLGSLMRLLKRKLATPL